MKRGKRNKDNSIGQTDGVILSGTIMSVMNRQARVLWENKEILCALPNNLVAHKNSLVVGDHVDVEAIGDDQFRLLRVAPRSTVVHRGNRKSPGEDISISANSELLLVVVTAKYVSSQAGYIEEAIIAAQRAEMKIGVYISKIDLVGEAIESSLEEKMHPYRNFLEFVHGGSALEPSAELVKKVQGRKICLVGDRASGKTSLAYSLLASMGDESSASRRIISTHSSCMFSDSGNTQIVDTPGFREWMLRDITSEERDVVLPEISGLAQGCRFSDCSHIHEDGCEVRQALREDALSRERYQVYQAMSKETQEEPTPQGPTKPNYREVGCAESFVCRSCGSPVGPQDAGTQHRNHCPQCLSSIHVDEKPGDRASLCGGVMEPVSVWVRKGGEWAIIHRCRLCGTLSSNRIAADDNPALLMSLAVRPLALAPFPLERIDQMLAR